MVFTSPIFLFLFLPAVLFAAFVTRRSVPTQNVILLAFSLLFYAWGEPVYIILLLACILVTYCGGLLMARAPGLSRWTLGAGIAINLGLLGYFKYAHFSMEQLSVLAPALQVELEPIDLPIGLSFFTFQAISYLVDVHRGQAQPASTPLRVGLYISMFPQLLAGPIVRYADIEQQLLNRSTRRSDVAHGIRRFTAGLAKKALIADPLAMVVEATFDPMLLPASPVAAWIGTMCFTLQIYFDFSGYSDMAIGLGRMFGIRIKENFNFPYISQSMTEFWRRWHISLSTWFRDYLYIPMGGNRRGSLRTVLHLWIVFLLCGLWHGASMVFVVWGAWHGALLSIERLAKDRVRVPRAIAHVYTLLAVTLGFTLFRCTSLVHAVQYVEILFGGVRGDGATASSVVDPHVVVIVIVAWALALDAPRAFARMLSVDLARPAFKVSAELWTLLVLFCSFVAVAATTFQPFVYFRF